MNTTILQKINGSVNLLYNSTLQRLLVSATIAFIIGGIAALYFSLILSDYITLTSISFIVCVVMSGYLRKLAWLLAFFMQAVELFRIR